MTPPTFFESLAIADAAVERFVGLYPTREPIVPARRYMREFCVPALRWLWRNGEVTVKTTIAARVAVWRGKDQDYVKELQKRIYERETKR